MTVTINWLRCNSYNDAVRHSRIIYLHEWNGLAFYWGKADKSPFGTRYGSGYSHWIEGCLRNGGKLYIGSIQNNDGLTLDEIEMGLITKYGSTMNKRIKQTPMSFEHSGEVPAAIRVK